MSDKTLFSDHELESLLRATFSAEARQRVPDSRTVPPFPATERLATVHPLRRKWTGVLLVAAALVAIVVGGSVIGFEALDADQPTPPATTGPPEPTVTSTDTTSMTPSTTASTPPAAVTHQVTVQGVTLSVPTAWTVGPDPTNPTGTVFPATCVGTAPDTATGCDLAIAVGPDDGGPGDVDQPGVTGDGTICGSKTQDSLETVTADQVQIDGQSAEHRVFTADCVDGSYEQWTVATAPMVRFVTRSAVAAVHVQVAAAVVTAQLPGPRSELRLVDRGYVAAVSDTTLSLDRVTKLYEPGRAPFLQDINPVTYDYPVGNVPGVRYEDPASQQQITFAPSDMVGLLDGPKVIAGVQVPALSSLQAFVETNGTAVTWIVLSARS